MICSNGITRFSTGDPHAPCGKIGESSDFNTYWSPTGEFMMHCVELFTGCGGLAMGLSRSGFSARSMIEWDRHSVVNVRHNRGRDVEYVRAWPIDHRDVRDVRWDEYRGIDLVAGGPPCQPFSIGGRHKGYEDGRDMWPETVRAVREIMPSGFLFENVRGLTRTAFADYLDWIVQSLSRPREERRDGETRREHLNRLLQADTPLDYKIRVCQVNAADFGAAQKRHRVIILGLRDDVTASIPPLVATHSREALLWDQWISGAYWARHRIKRPELGPSKMDVAIVRRLQLSNKKPSELPWRTVRDAMVGLGEPGTGSISNHSLQSGARSYPGHTGSPLDQPAKALKAGVHGVPGGENMINFADGSVRYFTVREAARLQGMPDEFEFVGSWSENMRQLGNAVPTELAEAVGRTMRLTLERASKSRRCRAA
jgi:DNA (cytosine-5)-methyltransferase 1